MRVGSSLPKSKIEFWIGIVVVTAAFSCLALIGIGMRYEERHLSTIQIEENIRYAEKEIADCERYKERDYNHPFMLYCDRATISDRLEVIKRLKKVLIKRNKS